MQRQFPPPPFPPDTAKNKGHINFARLKKEFPHHDFGDTAKLQGKFSEQFIRNMAAYGERRLKEMSNKPTPVN